MRHCFAVVLGLGLLACVPGTIPPVISPSIPAETAAATTPVATPPPTAVAVTASPSPTQTCVPVATPDFPTPAHSAVNGQPNIGVPIKTGVILVQIRQCRDIEAIVRKYGLPGPATRYIEGTNSPESATRWYRVGVAVGSEAAT